MPTEPKKWIELLKELKPETRPLWGTMTPQQMVEHLVWAVRMSSGEVEITETITPPEKIPVLKRFLMSPRQLPKNFNNPLAADKSVEYICENLDSAIELLAEEYKKHIEFFELNPEARPMNPTFGELSKTEWEKFHEKHFTHHLAQFDLL